MTAHKFKVGEKVKVTVRYKSILLPALFPNQPTSKTYEGTVVRSEGWEPDDTVNITSGEPRHPVRTVAFQNILSVNDLPFTFTPTVSKTEKPRDKQFEVTGSKGDKYLVTVKADGSRQCNCPGYGFRGKCKHLNMV